MADSLLTLEPETTQPRDLPGQYGRVVASLECLLTAVETQAVVAGGWAVWKHGFEGRVTQDIDIVVAREAIDSLLHAAAFAGFQALEIPPGRWLKQNWDRQLERTQSLSQKHPRLATRFAECIQEAKNEEEI